MPQLNKLSKMKKVLLLVVAFGMMSSCQPDECKETICVEKVLSARIASPTIIDLGGMNSNVFIGSMSGDLEEYQTTGDLNLNGYTLSLDNIKLTVVGNMNGNGQGGGSQVSTLGSSVVCVQGSIQNNPYYNANDFTCDSLSGGDFSSTYEGGVEVPCGEYSIGNFIRSNNSVYRVVSCF